MIAVRDCEAYICMMLRVQDFGCPGEKAFSRMKVAIMDAGILPKTADNCFTTTTPPFATFRDIACALLT